MRVLNIPDEYRFNVISTLVALSIGYFIGWRSREVLCIHRLDPSLRAASLGLLPHKEEQIICDKNSVLSTVFGMLHHPSCPDTAEVVLTQSNEWKDDFSVCEDVYAVRSPVRDDHPNKCYAVYRAPSNKSAIYHSTTGICHRTGSIDWPQVLTDQYQEDIIHSYSLKSHNLYTNLFLSDRDNIISHFKSIVGSEFDENGNRRTLVLMVANEGVLDLLLNLLCSAKAANVDVNNFVVFSGQQEYCTMIESLGVKAVYHKSLGDMPKEAAVNYADRIFTKLMWLKVTSVHTALAAGFHVLFQDVDLVWIRDPISFLVEQERYDIIFMDDGARTPRFAPYFTNTGFYFMRHSPKSIHLMHRLSLAVGEIDFTASHQATLIRHMTEIQGAFGMQILVLNDREFPSGRMYHEQHQFVEDVKNHKVIPFVWHMCWTANRGQKVEYYKDLGLWFLPPSEDGSNMCESAPKLLDYLQTQNTNIFDVCCMMK